MTLVGVVLVTILTALPPFAWAQAASVQTPTDQSVQRGRTLVDVMLGSEAGTEAPEEAERIDPDRPHFPEAPTTVGKGRVVLESGYTLTKRGSSFSSQSYPDALLRVGLFADWFEFRIGQTFLNEDHGVAAGRTRTSGAQDLYLGVKLALAEQRQFLPEVALLPQITVPTGSSAVTAGRVLLGVNLDCAWNVIKDRFKIELLIAANRVRSGVRHSHEELATGLTAAVDVTRNLEAFAEWDAFYPQAEHTRALRPQHYAIGGMVYFFTNGFAVDVRAGVGLNEHANDVVAGTGFAIRY